jgi:very-short-patch-repair endonuclease
VHVEIDGAQHIEAETWWADMRRQNALWIQGVRVLRFPAWVLRERPSEVFAQIRQALIEAGWRP